jgi:hypothetical protein
MIENLEIGRIRRDGGTQPRASLDEATIAEYAEALAGGAEFPPVDVFNDGERLWLADGYHRLAAHERAGKHFILATLHQGDRRAAVLFSTGVNAEHGLRRANADKRRAVEVLLRDPEWGKWADREIARQCKVSNRFVSDMRQELSVNGSQIGAPDERVVTRGGTTYTMKTGGIGTPAAPDPSAFATPEQLQAAVRSWLGSVGSGNRTVERNILTQIALQNDVGRDRLVELAEYAKKLELRGLLGQLKHACAAVAAELVENGPQTADGPQTPPVRRVPAVAPDPQAPPALTSAGYAAVWRLEQAVRSFLAARAGMLMDGETLLVLLRRMAERTIAQGKVDYEDLRNNGSLPMPYHERDLQQALNNVLAQMVHAQRQAEVGQRTMEELIPAVWAWLGLDPAAQQQLPGHLDWAAGQLAGALDLEGWAARRGRNFQWENLVGAVGAGVDHARLREAVRVCWLAVVAKRDAAQPTTDDGRPAAAAEPSPVAQWLALLAEENEIPADRHGEPEPDAARMVLESIARNRSNGGAEAWRKLRAYPGWPAGASDGAKLAAVQAELARYAPRVVDAGPEPPAGRPEPAAVNAMQTLLARKEDQVLALRAAAKRALAYLRRLGADEPEAREPELVQTIAALEQVLG